MKPVSRFIIVIAVLCRYVADGVPCEKIEATMCDNMPYNMTRMPNLLHHSTQKNAILALDQFKGLVDTKCSESLLFFLCSMFVPICATSGGTEVDLIPPCRGECLNAKRGCLGIMLRYNVSWPENLDCERLPVYSEGVCIKPDAIISRATIEGASRSTNGGQVNVGGGGGSNGDGVSGLVVTGSRDGAGSRGGRRKQKKKKYKRGKESQRKTLARCKCRQTKLKKRPFLAANYEYAIKATWKAIEPISEGITHLTFTVDDVMKGSPSFRLQTTSDLVLLSNDTCICPRFNEIRKYMIAGYENGTNGQLGYSFAVPWKNVMKRKIQNWMTFKKEDNGVDSTGRRSLREQRRVRGRKRKVRRHGGGRRRLRKLGQGHTETPRRRKKEKARRIKSIKDRAVRRRQRKQRRKQRLLATTSIPIVASTILMATTQTSDISMQTS